MTGSVPLRSFGQLKQLFETRGKDEPEGRNRSRPASENAARDSAHRIRRADAS